MKSTERKGAVWEKVYDKVCREKLWRVLHECGFDRNLIRSMGSLYDGSRACVRLGSRMEEYFEVRGGLRWVHNVPTTLHYFL